MDMYLIFKLNGCQETLSNPLTLALIPARSCSPDSIKWTVDCHDSRGEAREGEGSNFKFEEKERKTRDYKNAAAALPEVGIATSKSGVVGMNSKSH